MQRQQKFLKKQRTCNVSIIFIFDRKDHSKDEKKDRRKGGKERRNNN